MNYLLRKSGEEPDKLSRLRQKLYQKAKQEPRFKFYSLYAHLWRDDVLWEAWKRVKANKGSAGVDGVTFSAIESSEGGVKEFLEEIRKSLKSRTYKPSPIKRVYIPKANGTQRPLGIPTIRDRVVQMAALLMLEPIFEADFLDCSYGFRPERNAHQALAEIRTNLKDGYCAVYDLDLQQYFDSIPHDKLMKCVEMRISDRSILKLIRQWLKALIKEEPKDKNGKPKWTKPRKGTPQGGVISPLLANIYLHWFDNVFHRSDGPGTWAKAKLVRYADDLVIMARFIDHRIINYTHSKLEDWLGLKINQDKTRLLNLYEEKSSLDFLGFTFRWDKGRKCRNPRYLNVFPSKKVLQRERNKIQRMTSSRLCFVPITEIIKALNIHLASWATYFRYGYPGKSFRHVNAYTRLRLTKFLKRKSQRPQRPPEGVSYYEYFKGLNLIYL